MNNVPIKKEENNGDGKENIFVVYYDRYNFQNKNEASFSRRFENTREK